MFRRWWQGYGLGLLFIGVSLTAALYLRNTNGRVVQDLQGILFNHSDANLSSRDRDILLQNSKLQELQTLVDELEAQNQQLQALLNYQNAQTKQAIAAPVIGRSADAWWQQMIIGQGSEAGIKIGDTVTGIGGLVGHIIQVTPQSSRVVLIGDLNQQTGAMVSRSRIQGYLKGLNDPQIVEMVFYEKVIDAKIGDQVITSNLSTMYNPGIPIGEIVALDLNAGPAPVATVKLSVPLGALEWVLVSSFTSKPLEFEQKNGSESS